MALCSTHSSMSMSLLFEELRAGHNIADMSYCPIVNERERTSSLDLMGVLFLMQPWRLLAFFAASYSASIRNPRFLLQICFPAGWPHPVLVQRVNLCQVQEFCIFFFLNSMRFLPSHFCSLLKLLWMAAQLSRVSDTSSQFPIICKLTKVVPCPSFLVIKEEVKQYSLYELWGFPLVTGFQLKFCCWSQLFETGCSASFQHTSLFIYLVHTSSVCLWECDQRQCQRPS